MALVKDSGAVLVAGRLRGADDAVVDAFPASTAEATLSVELDAKEPRGTLRLADAEPLRFSGWLELASAIEAMRALAAAGAQSSGKRGTS